MKKHLFMATALLASSAYGWEAGGPIALTETSGGLVVGIVFLPQYACDQALMTIFGLTGELGAVTPVFDGEEWEEHDIKTNADGVAYLSLSKDGLKAIKHGRLMTLATATGRITVPLTGSATALNQAWASCEATISQEITRAAPTPTPAAAIGADDYVSF